MPQSRKLAAIMFTDIVGYTALMGIDESKAFQFLQKNRSIQKPIIEEYNGHFIKEIGDGILASFNNVYEAVNAAIKIQVSLNSSKEFFLRIGIHLGEVIFENEDVFGDGVNIASRIQAIANPGSIFISEAVRNNVINKTDINARFVKMATLKNVKEPVRIYEITLGQGQSIEKKELKDIPQNSIAVLPFSNMSSDPEQEYFSDGMAEEIINSLAHLKDLKVAGRTSAFQFKGKNIDHRELADKLGVRTILEGSVRKQGNRLRITTQLINAEDGFHIWSERYDRNLDDIFAIQDEIALAITDKLKVTLFGNDRELITKVHTLNKIAYDSYLKGKFYLNRRGKSILKAIDYFREAINIDKDFALAHSGYADASFLCAFYSLLPGNKVMYTGKDAAEIAIKIDPSICEPYASLGFYYTAFEWNWEEGNKYFLRSLELNPSYSFCHSVFGLYYYAWGTGNFAEAESHGLEATKIDPFNSVTHAVYSLILYTAGKLEDSLAAAITGIELDGNSFLCYRGAALSYRSLKRYTEAVEINDHLLKISNRHIHAIYDRIAIDFELGNLANVKTLMQELKDRSVNEFMNSAYMGIASSLAGNLDEAFNYFDSAIKERDPLLITLKYIKYSEDLYNDPRYPKLIERIGFPR